MELPAGLVDAEVEARVRNLLARLERDEQGQAKVSVFPSRSSGVLSSVVWANGLAVIPEKQVISRGDAVDFLPFSELL